MMELVRFGLINWYLMPKEEIDIKGNTAILGKNASGKSNLLDMTQVVLTGWNKSQIKLNASAGDGKKKRSERSVRAYCLGTYGDGKTKRKSGKTILFLGFRDEQSGRALTVGVALEFDITESAERLLDRFIVPGVVLSTDVFLQMAPDGKHEIVKDWPSCKLALEKAAAGGSVLFDGTSEAYIKNWTKIASTGRRSIQPARLMKALVTAISFEEIKSATEFVRDYVLSPDPLEIGDLKTSIKTYHDLHRKIVDLKVQLQWADEICEKARLHGRHIKSRGELRAAGAMITYASARAYYFQNRADLARAEIERVQLERDLGEIDRAGQNAASEIKDVTALIVSRRSNNGRDLLEVQQEKAALERSHAEKELERLYRGAVDLVRKSESVNKREPLGPIINPLAGVVQSLQAAQHPNWPKDVSAYLSAAELIDRFAPAVVDSLKVKRDRMSRRRAELEDKATELRETLDNLRSLGVAIRTSTRRLSEALRDIGMSPRILCQLVDVTDESWLDAAEIMLGADREAIIVDARHATKAKQFVQVNHADFPGARIVGTDKEDWRSTGHKPDSLAAVISTDDPDARILVDKRLGSIRRAETIADFRKAGRAVMRDGMVDDGIIVEKRRVVDGRKIGRAAADPAALEAEIRAIEAEYRMVSQVDGEIKDLIDALTQFCATGTERAGAIIAEFEGAAERLRKVTEDIQKVDQDIDPELAERLRKAEILRDSLKRDRESKVERRGALNSQIAGIENSMAQNELMAGSREHMAAKRKDFLHSRGMADRKAFCSRAREAVGKRSLRQGQQLDRIARTVFDRSDQEFDAARTVENAVFDQVLNFHHRWQSADGLTRETSKIAGDVLPHFENLAAKIREAELVEHERQAREAAESTRGMFQTAFVASLSDKIRHVEDEIERLRAVLHPHRFNNERYSFRATRAADYAELIEFVEEAAADETKLLPLLDPDESKRLEGPAAAINRILMDENFDVSEFDDYRRYFNFDLIIHDDRDQSEMNLERRKGIGSGAERQVPFYVAIGAALAAAWHGGRAERDKQPSGLGVALFDEAFSKMDASNQRACIGFFDRLGLQTIIAAPPEKRSIALGGMRTIVDISREHTDVDIATSYVKDETHRRIRELDPTGLTPDDIRAAWAVKAAAGELNGHADGAASLSGKAPEIGIGVEADAGQSERERTGSTVS